MSSRCGTSFLTPEFIAMLRQFKMAPVYTEHDTYPNIADVTADFVYARLQRGEDNDPDRLSAESDHGMGGSLADLGGGQGAEGPRPRRWQGQDRKPQPRDVFAYVIHEGKVRAPAAAMALIEKLKG